MKRKRKWTLIFIVCALSLSNCKKADTQHTVPPVAINISIATNLAQYNNLNFVGGWVYLNGGYNGLLVYRATSEEFRAYDRQAPYVIKDLCQIFVDSNEVTVIDTCSGSRWLLLDGQIIEGPAFYPLKQYQTFYDGSTLTISN